MAKKHTLTYEMAFDENGEPRADAPTCATCGDSSAWGTHQSCERDEGVLLVLVSDEDFLSE